MINLWTDLQHFMSTIKDINNKIILAIICIFVISVSTFEKPFFCLKYVPEIVKIHQTKDSESIYW